LREETKEVIAQKFSGQRTVNGTSQEEGLSFSEAYSGRRERASGLPLAEPAQ